MDYEWEILSANWTSTLLIFGTVIFSFAISFSVLGLHGVDYLHLLEIKDYIYKSSLENNHLLDFQYLFGGGFWIIIYRLVIYFIVGCLIVFIIDQLIDKIKELITEKE